MVELKKGDFVVVVDDGSKTGTRKVELRNGDEHTIQEVRGDGMVRIDGSDGWYYPRRFVLDPKYGRTGTQVQLPAGGLGQALNGGSIPQGWGPPVSGPLSGAMGAQGQNAQSASGPDPAKPFPDPVAEREKSAAEKLREYRKSVRDLIGGY